MKVCPTEPEDHLQFHSGATVCQVWVVDGDGNYIAVFDETAHVMVHAKKNMDEATCVECGADAVEASTLEPAPTHAEAWLAKRAAEWEKEQFRGYPLPPSKEVMKAWKKAFDALTTAGLELARLRDEEKK